MTSVHFIASGDCKMAPTAPCGGDVAKEIGGRTIVVSMKAVVFGTVA
jgi:hypothetical protein